MNNSDYGPIPESRLMEEAAGIFAALREKRRVLVSRQGVVVAAITRGPAVLNETLGHIQARERMLTDFERNHPNATPEEFADAGEKNE